MKKIMMTLAAAVCTLAAMANTYTGQLSVSINGVGGLQDGVAINMDQNEDGTYNFSLKNFVFYLEGEPMPVGNIELNNLTATEGAQFKNVSFTGGINILPGSTEEFPNEDDWAGPYLEEVPLVLNAAFNDMAISVHIDIEMAVLSQTIKVDFIAAAKQGDVNLDNEIGIADVTSLVNIVLEQE